MQGKHEEQNGTQIVSQQESLAKQGVDRFSLAGRFAVFVDGRLRNHRRGYPNTRLDGMALAARSQPAAHFDGQVPQPDFYARSIRYACAGAIGNPNNHAHPTAIRSGFFRVGSCNRPTIHPDSGISYRGDDDPPAAIRHDEPIHQPAR